MKRHLNLLLFIVGAIFLSGCSSLQNTSIDNNSGLNQQLSGLQQQMSGVTAQIEQLNTTTPTKIIDSRYRKIYSNQYSIYKKDSMTYEICLAGNKDICINLIQYNGTFKDYYNTFMPIWYPDADLPLWSSSDTITGNIIKGKKERTCFGSYAESSFCVNENKNGSLIMSISDQMGIGFHGGEYDPKEILKVIDF